VSSLACDKITDMGDDYNRFKKEITCWFLSGQQVIFLD
jgi:hypothetical protein